MELNGTWSCYLECRFLVLMVKIVLLVLLSELRIGNCYIFEFRIEIYTSNILFVFVFVFEFFLRIFFWEEGGYMINFLKSLKIFWLDDFKGFVRF